MISFIFPLLVCSGIACVFYTNMADTRLGRFEEGGGEI